MLIRREDAAHGKVLAAIERDLLRQPKQTPSQFRKLHNLIRLLGRAGEGTSEGDVARLLEKCMAHIASQPAEPQVVVRQYGERLLKLRDKVKGRWKKEVQLALDAARVEDNLELSAAMLRMKEASLGSSSRRTIGSFTLLAVKMAISPDGKHLAVGDRRTRVGALCRLAHFGQRFLCTALVARRQQRMPDGVTLVAFLVQLRTARGTRIRLVGVGCHRRRKAALLDRAAGPK